VPQATWLQHVSNADNGGLAPAGALQTHFSQSMELFNQAISLHQQGRLPEARQRYEQWRRMNPGDINALQLLSVCLAQMGELPQALQMLDQAIALAPQQPAFHNNRANMLRLLGRLPEALQSCTRAIQLKPDYAEAYNNRGNVQQDLKLTDLALKDYAEAIRLNPNYAEAIYNRAVAQQSVQKHAEAIEGLNKVLALAPGQAQALARLAVSYSHLREYEKAKQAITPALQAQPDNTEFLLIAATLAVDFARYDEAIEHCEKLLARVPDNAAGLAKLAFAHHVKKHPVKARLYADRALAADPSHIEARLVQGHLLASEGLHEEALVHYQKAVEKAPTSGPAHLYAGQMLSQLKRFDEGLHLLEKARELEPEQGGLLDSLIDIKLSSADWQGLDALIADLKQAVLSEHIQNQPLTLAKVFNDPMLLKQGAEKVGKGNTLTDEDKPKFARRDPRRQKIRIAYVSADFGDHPVALLLLETLTRHDRDRFELYAFSLGPMHDDQMNRRITECFHRFLDVHESSDADVADMARQLGIDIAIDLTGYTAKCRPGIFANRAAPVQVNYLGFPGTLGAPYMDYLIADPVVIPDELRPAYTEQIAYLPDQFMPNDTRRIVNAAPSRASQQLPESGFVFCGFNNLNKLTPEVFDSWMRILQAVPDSVLWLQAGGAVQKNLREQAELRGVPGSRLVFAGRVPSQADHLARYALADLFLDTAPYNAHATAMDALWAGLPVLTCMGQTFASRVAGSLVSAAGLPELATTERAEFERLAIRIAQTPGQAQALKDQLAAGRAQAPLYNNTLFTRNLERLYEQMYQRHLQSLPPTALKPEPVSP